MVKRSVKKVEKTPLGRKKIPIRNVVVMIDHKPREEFEHVKVLSLNELNDYVQYFKPIFHEDEVTAIASLLAWVQGYN